MTDIISYSMTRLRKEFGFRLQVSEEDIGEKIGVNPRIKLEGIGSVWVYTGRREAVIAVKGRWIPVVQFFTFESYNNNQDEDAIAYLNLYGINGPQDIKAVQLIEYSEESKVEGKLNIVGDLLNLLKLNSSINIIRYSKCQWQVFWSTVWIPAGCGSG